MLAIHIVGVPLVLHRHTEYTTDMHFNEYKKKSTVQVHAATATTTIVAPIQNTCLLKIGAEIHFGFSHLQIIRLFYIYIYEFYGTIDDEAYKHLIPLSC